MPSSGSVAVVIPTFNRLELLREAVASVLGQEYVEFEVIILDDCSSDGTQSAFEHHDNPRVRYLRNAENLGLVRNWNRALQTPDTDYVCLLQDDDRLLPGYLPATVGALEAHPEAAFAYTLATTIDAAGMTGRAGSNRRQFPEGLVSGGEYLHRIVSGENWVIHASSALWRRSRLPATGPFDAPHTTHTIDFDLFFRTAASHDLVAIHKHLVQVRSHEEQLGREHLGPIASYGMVAERTDALASLLNDPRAADPAYRRWLSERLLNLSQQRSDFAQLIEPAIGLPWDERLQLAAEEVRQVSGAGDHLVLVDDYQWGDRLGDRKMTRFGETSGTPASSDDAIHEVETLREAGATHLVVAWPSLWVLDYYGGLRSHLAERYALVLRNSRVTVYDLAGQPDEGA